MPHLTSTVLTDRAATPVAHTFEPDDKVGNVGFLVESDGVPIGNSKLSVSLRKTQEGRRKAEVKLVIPVTDTVTGEDGVEKLVVLRTNSATLLFDYAPTSTLAERNNLVGMLADALEPEKVVINDTVVKLQGVY
jgi:hypothetical protein